jgi:hypothetical protein
MWGGVGHASVGDMHIEVLQPGTSNLYLGRAFSLTNVHDTELDFRIRRAWAKFGAFKHELTDKSVPLHLRLKLFHSVVTPTVMYGSGTWVMTVERQTKLARAQLRMVRSILGRTRRLYPSGNLETWVDWMQRVTAEARMLLHEHGIPLWVSEWENRLTKWARNVASMQPERWARRVLDWHPSGRRSRGRPVARWQDQHHVLSLLRHAQ